MFLNKGTSQPEASQEKVNGDIIDMEFVEELDDVQLAMVVGGQSGLSITSSTEGTELLTFPPKAGFSFQGSGGLEPVGAPDQVVGQLLLFPVTVTHNP